ncbi:MAG: ferredoxin family protein [Pseudomonadota bacterium]
MNNVRINRNWCKNCGICIEFCPAGVFNKEIDGTPVLEHQERCSGCRLCELRCPDFAVRVEAEANEGK